MRGVVYSFPPRALEGFPHAQPFMEHLLAQGRTSVATATNYVKIAARLWRARRMNIDLTHVNEVTVARAFRRWWLDAYVDLVTPVVRALGPALGARAAIARLRRSSLVAPLPGKLIPLPRLPGADIAGLPLEQVVGRPPQTESTPPTLSLVSPTAVPPADVEWKPAPDVWTLHVPPRADTPPHTDPCAECRAIELTLEQLNVMAEAFKKAWGHMDINQLLPDTFLFGEPPPDYGTETARPAMTAGRIIALVRPGALAESLIQLGGSVARNPREFEELTMAELPETIVISRSACERVYKEVLHTVRETWKRLEEADVASDRGAAE